MIWFDRFSIILLNLLNLLFSRNLAISHNPSIDLMFCGWSCCWMTFPEDFYAMRYIVSIVSRLIVGPSTFRVILVLSNTRLSSLCLFSTSFIVSNNTRFSSRCLFRTSCLYSTTVAQSSECAECRMRRACQRIALYVRRFTNNLRTMASGKWWMASLSGSMMRDAWWIGRAPAGWRAKFAIDVNYNRTTTL